MRFVHKTAHEALKIKISSEINYKTALFHKEIL